MFVGNQINILVYKYINEKSNFQSNSYIRHKRKTTQTGTHHSHQTNKTYLSQIFRTI